MKNFKAQNSIEHNIFSNHFTTLNDPRRTTKGNFYYPLQEILFLTICAVLSGFKEWTVIETFGNTKLDWLRKFYPYKHGIPSHDVLGKVFSRLDPVNFNRCFTEWINDLSKITEGEIISIDGKSIRGSGDSNIKKSAIHIVSAYASENRLCLTQTTVDSKENEIVAIPRILELLEIKNCVVTLDAMGCQKEIAKTIIEKKADYVLMVKDNQEELSEQVKKLFKHHKTPKSSETLDHGHGRVETRKCEVIDELTFFDERESWIGLKTLVKITSTRYIKKTGEETTECRYYISSLPADPARLNYVIRSHWAIENKLHWNLDVVFGEDAALKKKDNAAINFNIINKFVLTILEKDKTTKGSKPSKRAKAALDDNFREGLLKS